MLYRVSVTRTETFAEIEVHAASEVEAREKATTSEALNGADWQVSDGNFIRRDDCEVYAVDEIED